MMAFVFECSQCGKKFQVHQGGVTVACPHCGSHEKIPGPEAAVPEATPVAPPLPPGGEEIGEMKTDLSLDWLPPVEEPEPTQPWMPPVDTGEPSVPWSPSGDDAPAGAEAPDWMPPAESEEPPPPWSPGDDDDDLPRPAWLPGGEEVPALDWPPGEPNPGGSSTITAEATQTTTPVEAPPAEPLPAVLPVTPAAPVVNAPAISSVAPTTRKSASPPKKGLSSFQLLIYYATAITALCAYLLYTLYLKPPHQLESLPDIPPLKDGETQIVPENAKMPRFHTLALGEEQRYGNLRVKPLRVTRETVSFHSGPETVLRLWLDLTNVSSDQPFIPIGEELHDAQVPDKHPDARSIFRANNFVSRVSEKTRTGHRVLLMSSWQQENQKLNDPLPPGETRKTALSTESDGIDALKGPLVWRLHLRKGHNPDSGHGVTTVIEVSFDSSDIEAKG